MKGKVRGEFVGKEFAVKERRHKREIVKT